MPALDTSTDDVNVALYRAAVADVIAAIATSIEAQGDGVDFATWLADITEHWTRDHGRAAVMVCGMLLAASDTPVEALAAIGRALIHPDGD